jgi:ribosomal-protein-alanine N-acetyltransferase
MSSDDLTISVARVQHAAEIGTLHGQLFEKAWARDDIARLLEHAACVALVAVPHTESGAIGFLLAQSTPGEAEILSLGVARSWQRRGVGRRLVQGLIQHAACLSAKRIFLDVGERNTPAVRLYQSLGFTQIARRKGYYVHAGGHHEDALLMVRNL